MKIAIVYFTGTYNTRYLAEKIQNMFSHAEEIKVVEVRRDSEIIDLNNYDLLFVGYPIYGFTSFGNVGTL